ncbi:MAG: glycosyltransferase family 4 protein [Chloroflexi bacterium]|nr:glycosyltransferase family 4 protein [Chloroflexota bacterium]
MKYPKVLRVETGLMSSQSDEASSDMLDYRVYACVPRWWRRLEELLHLDIYLALRARAAQHRYDIVWAGSEKVGIPLSFIGLRKPLVVVAHHLESPAKAELVRMTGIAKRWAGIGYISNESRDFFVRQIGIPAGRLFQFESAKYLSKVTPTEKTSDGPIISAGVAKRDYATLIKALADLPGYETELLVSSKFGDKLKSNIKINIPEWVCFTDFMPDDELMKHYERARFVIVPLESTTHRGAGINVVLEAAAFGKAVIATKTGGMSTFVKDGETGILVPPYDVEAMRSAIQKLWTQPGLARQMGLAGRCHVEAHFDPVAVNSNITAFLKKIHLASVAPD